MTSEHQIISETDLNEDVSTDVAVTGDEAEAPVETSRLDHDQLLQELVAYANHWGIRTVVTLNLGGSMVSGTIISTREYLDKFAAEYRKHLSPIPEAAEALGDRILSFKPDEPKTDDPLPAQKPRFINLENVRTYAPGRPQLAISSSLWRGNIAGVTGFFIGAPPPPESK